jgi:sterol desaturase/sphingolipid hydroxylase (fatty acid hydroxylase superfamily)
MVEWLIAKEGALRLICFVSLLILLLVLQALAPRRPLTQSPRRWGVNLGMVALDALLARLLIPLGAVGTALWAQVSGTGLLHAVALPAWLEFALAFLALDCLIYWQHRIFHMVPAFWRLHRMHHSDLEFDTTTGVRFHPVEILLSMLIKMAAVAALGAPAAAVIVFEMALNATSLFNHANLHLPLALDRILRRAVVTPDMHRVHHSIHSREYNRNFGFNFPWWDRLFGSYAAQPEDGHERMAIGLPRFREPETQGFAALLAQPLKPL